MSHEHEYKCAICSFETTQAARLEAHLLERHPQAPTAGLVPPLLRNGQLTTPTELLTDHLQSLLND